MLERVLYAEKVVKDLNEMPSGRPDTPSVAMVLHSRGPHPEKETHRIHYAKLVMSPGEFTSTFAPDNDHITYVDASFFGNELRYEHNGVIVDCLMTDSEMKAFYGDMKLARRAKEGSRLY